jgi:ATP-dependent helicase/nuclease subunit A
MSTLTPAQQAAVDALGNVLVVAGAGTGKTRTLVERCLTLLVDEGVSIENILMVTFTEAAAAEMHERIRKAILEEQDRTQDPARVQILAQQLALLDTAYISTLHGFCLTLLRQYFYVLDLDPQISVLDDPQTQPLIQQCFDQLFAASYAATTPDAEATLALMRRWGGSEHELRRIVLKIHRYAQSLDNPDGWLREQQDLFATAEPTRWRRWLVAAFAEWRDLWLPALTAYPKPAKNLLECVRALEATLPIVAAPRFPAEAGQGRGLPNEDGVALTSVRGALAAIKTAHDQSWKPQTAQRDAFEKFFADAAFLGSLALATETDLDPLAQDWGWVRQPTLALLKLTRDFGELFAKSKRELGGVDFADLEQLTLRLLWDTQAGAPTAVAQEWRQRLRYVFVDEYQDINGVQNAILRALSRPDAEGNRFLVGDIKQSIYRFRLADPGIFERYESHWRTGGAGEGRCIDLADNFRSREAILNFVNALFGALMRPNLGGADYAAQARLLFGEAAARACLAASPPDPGRLVAGQEASWAGRHRVEVHLVSTEAEDQTNSRAETGSTEADSGTAEIVELQTAELEARLVAQRLRALSQAGHLIWDESGHHFRPVRWSDMVVLLRSARNRAECFAKEFSRQSVPLLAERGGFYDTTEIQDLLSLLRVLDNPLQDVPLLAVLRSPLAGLSLDELAAIRSTMRKGLFWAALQEWQRNHSPGNGPEGSASEPALFSKLDLFLTRFEAWRRIVREGSLSPCLETVLSDTHYEAILLSQDRGAERVANVRRLLSLASRFDPLQRQGLFRFLCFVEAQQEAGTEEDAAPPPTRDAVRLLTMHKSKGLEFPVVVVAGLGSPFNFRDLSDRVLVSHRYGLCPKVYPPAADGAYPSLAHWLAQRHERAEGLGEELRLLYVALTRARDTLILVATAGTRAASQPWSGEPARRFSDHELLHAVRPLDWLRLWLPQVTRPEDWVTDLTGGNDLLRWTIHWRDDPALGGEPAAEPTDQPLTSPALGTADQVEALRERLLWRYPFSEATREPAKASVSALRRRAAEDEEAAVVSFVRRAATAPSASEPRRLSASERGTAHHLFIQRLNLAHLDSEPALRGQGRELVRQGWLSADEEAALDYQRVLEFWHTALGRSIRTQPPGCVQRELPFTVRFDTREMAALGLKPLETNRWEALGGESILVQGTVDLAVLKPSEIWLVDFKTDQVKAAAVAEKVEAYRPQIALYALALERIYQRPVSQRWLHFLTAGETASL